MIYLIEGADGGGKSKLVDYLQEHCRKPLVQHRSRPKSEEDRKDMYDSYINILTNNETSRDYIFDRCWISEMVYGSVMRDNVVLSTNQFNSLCSTATMIGAIVIYCKTAPALQFQNAQRRGESYITDYQTFLSIYKEYEKVMSSLKDLGMKVVVYDYTRKVS